MIDNHQMESSFTVEKLRVCLKEAKEARSKTQKSIQTLDAELKRLYAKSSKKPHESMQHLDKRIADLEYKRTTTSLRLSEEKSILREISSVQRVKSQLDEYNANERLIQEKKAQLALLRNTLKQNIVQIHELEGAVSKAEMAGRLNCTVTELRTETVQCPPDKIGRVIGRKGSVMKQIREKTQAKMDVNSSKGTIELTGSTSALEAAKAEIERIANAIEARVEISDELAYYLTGKHTTKLDELRHKHSKVSIDIPRHQCVVLIRGLPEDVEEAKADVASLTVTCESLLVTHQESRTVIGRKGATIEKLVMENGVMIKLEDNKDFEGKTSLTVTGPLSNVEGAFEAIEHLIEENRDITEFIAASAIVRNAFLMNSGASIKQLQKSISDRTSEHGGRVLLSFAEDGQLKLRGRRSAVHIATPIVQEAISVIEASVVTVDVEPDLVPRIIGKGGSGVKELRREFKDVVIELEGDTGKAYIYGSDGASVEAVQRRMLDIVAANHLHRIDCPSGSLWVVFRDMMKQHGDELREMLSSVDCDEPASQILLRGSAENLEKATAIISEYLLENYVEDVEYVAEDESSLMAGGKDSVVSKVASEFEVTTSLMRSKSVVMVRGREERVKSAAKKLQQFLLGGDGHVIQRLSVAEKATGLVVGKGGSRRAELENEHGVSISISRSNRIAIRGPEENVKACRIDILRLVTAVRVHESIPITQEQRAKLAKPRQIIKGVPVELVVTEDAVKVRGISGDVKDAVALLKEELTGVYESRIELDAPQVSKLRSACRDPAHFQRIKSSSNAEVVLDLVAGAVIMTGERRNVSNAKAQVMDLLDFLLPSNFAHLKVSKPLQNTVGSTTALVDVAVQTCTSVSLDRDLSMIHIHSSEPERVEAAVLLLQPKIEEAEKLVHIYSFDSSEAWLLPQIIGRGGARVNALRSNTGCQIDVNKEDLTVTISGPDAESLTKARHSLEDMMDRARRENAFVEIPPDAMAPFLGRSWKHIKAFSEEHGVEMDRPHKGTSTIKISGSAENVKEAKTALAEWVAEYEDQQASLSIPIRKASIPAIVGKEGSVIATLQRDFACRIEIDRDASTVTISGGSSEKRGKLAEKVDAIIAKDEEQHAAARRKESMTEDKEKTPQCNDDPAFTADDVDVGKDRSSEFAPLPVGMARPSKHHNKLSETDAVIRPATAAGQNLLDLLLGGSTTAYTGECGAGMSLLVAEETWDSSTVSSAIVESSSSEEDSNTPDHRASPAVGAERSYYKSASGFTVRV